MLPFAPVRLTTITDWPSRRDIGSATARAYTSGALPGSLPTTIVIGLAGQGWANAAQGVAPSEASSRTNSVRRVFMLFLRAKTGGKNGIAAGQVKSAGCAEPGIGTASECRLMPRWDLRAARANRVFRAD